MKFGLFSMNTDACVEPEVMVRIAQKAESVGFESLWAGEHIVLPDPQVPPSPMHPEDAILDPIVALTFLAAHTKSVKLGTGIIILPQRNPLILAKEIASLDQLSNGRLLFGIGVGYLQQEFAALGIPFEDRGVRADEYLAAMHTMWTESNPRFTGKYIQFANVQAHPQRNINLVIGGHSTATYRRALKLACGWYGFYLSVRRTAEIMQEIRELEVSHPRAPESGELEISITPKTAVPTTDEVQAYAELGVHRLILMPPRNLSAQALAEYVDTISTTLIQNSLC